jgi:hypothetical protein
MAPSARLFAALAQRSRESARRRRSRDLKVESLEPRLALATGLLSTLVSIRDESGQKLLAPGAMAEIAEGEQLTASVRLTRKPDSAITVSFKSLAPLEVAAPPTTLRFTKANWNQPQTVTFDSFQDNVRDGDHLVPVKMTTAVARNPQRQAARKVWVESLDSGVVASATPVTATQRGSLSGGGASGSVVGTYDAVTNRGTATLTVTMPTLNKVRDRVITVGYSLGVDNRVQIESLAGITASRFRWDATYRDVGNDRGLFGTVTVLQPKLGKSATAMMTAAAVPEAVQELAATATGVGSLRLSWNAPPGGATSYTVTMTTTTGTGSSTQTRVTTDPSVTYTGLSPANSYAFSVTASNASGTGIAAQTSFGQAPIPFPRVFDIASGSDGSIYATSYGSSLLQDSYFTNLQQIVNKSGTWTAQPGIEFPGISEGDYFTYPEMTIGLDESIWVVNSPTSVQQVINTNGVLTAQPEIGVAGEPRVLTTGLDGSIWVAIPGAIQQIVNEGGAWTAQPPTSTVVGYESEFAVAPGPWCLTTGLDGSIWTGDGYNGPGFKQKSGVVRQIVNKGGEWAAQPVIVVGYGEPLGFPTSNSLTTGLDGSIWVAVQGLVQQIVNESGVWTAQPAILGFDGGGSLTTGLNGSIWGSNSANTVQQITNTGGVWTAQPAIGVGSQPGELTTGLDGSIWVANWGSAGNRGSDGNVQQIVLPPQSGPKDLKAVFGPAAGQITLGWQPPLANGGSPIIFYTATVAQGDSFQTITTTSTSVVFDGLSLGSGPTYFTVTATNFAGVSPTVGHFIDAAGNTIPQQSYAIGLATDGTPFAGGGFDGDGYAYSWEAMGNAASGGTRVGSTLAWNGVTFDLDGPNQPNFTWAAGQTIPVPQGDFNTLNLAGAAVNGSQTNQQITLTFTDGSSAVWTQSFSDWCSPQNYGHEAIISTQSYRDTASGGTNQTTNRIYGYSYTMPSGKTLASITLPQNRNVRLLDIQMSTATSVNLSGAYTSWGIANGNTQVANHQGFDGGGYYYYSGNLGSTIPWSGATFQFGPVPNSKNGQNNFVQAKGQSINLPQGDYGWLYLAGAAANGSQQNQQITLTFTDGSTDTWTQSFSDWCGPQNYAGETIIQQQPNRVNQVGNVHSQTNYVYGYAYQIPAGKTLASVKLPNNTNKLGILGMSML